MTDKHPPKQPPKSLSRTPPAYTPLAWSYPFSLLREVHLRTPRIPLTYMQVLATAEDGFYPLGGGIWHGGIHFGQKR
jgi:RNA 3'-terminal phosphate cyclase